MRLKLRAEACILLALPLVGLTGCARPSAYQTPVGKVRDASGVVIEAARLYLTELTPYRVPRSQRPMSVSIVVKGIICTRSPACILKG